MSFNYLTSTPLHEALSNYLETLVRLGYAPGAEVLPVQEAAFHITAKPVYAAICAPHYPASAMDGIALASGLTYNATETTPMTLRNEQFHVVDTGDPIPDGCDAVVMIEDVIRDTPDTVKIYKSVAPWQHIRQIGEDICAGEMILGSFMEITPASVGAMIACGITRVEVLKKPVVGFIPTGDEIVPPTPDPAPGDILEFNSSIFSAMLREWKADVRVYPIVPDVREEIRAALKMALRECDIVLLGAGSSAGRDDYSSEMVAEMGQVLYHGIAIKPGKPAILGYREHQPIVGIPGYPVSGIIVLQEIVKPLIDEWYRSPGSRREMCTATLTKPIISGLKYEEFVRVRLGEVAGKIMASPLNRGSGVVSSFMKADGIVRVPQDREGYAAGDTVEIDLLRPLSQIENTVVAIGSHDPLLDEVADLLHTKYPNLYMMSSHVGSMGGLMAVKRGETHIAGTHLLNEQDGSYNVSFIRKRFPKGGVKLVECVQRVQGLMLAKGNPMNIQSIADLTKKGLRYVNRQKGSGTRILIDYLTKKEGIDTDKIYGYDREEYTHTSVAAQIASGTADAGMGILSAAKLYDLDFVPICMEQYDLLIPDSAFDSEMIRRLLEVLKSPEFAERLASLGGYELDRPGTVRSLAMKHSESKHA